MVYLSIINLISKFYHKYKKKVHHFSNVKKNRFRVKCNNPLISLSFSSYLHFFPFSQFLSDVRAWCRSGQKSMWKKSTKCVKKGLSVRKNNDVTMIHCFIIICCVSSSHQYLCCSFGLRKTFMESNVILNSILLDQHVLPHYLNFCSYFFLV